MEIKINYITFDAWWDTDTTMIPNLSNVFDLDVYCLNHTYRATKYPSKTVPSNIHLTQVNQKHRDKSLSAIISALKYFCYTYLKNRNGNSIFFVTPITNFWFSLLFLLFFPKSRTIISSHNYIEHNKPKSLFERLRNKIKMNTYKKFNYFHFYSKYQMDLFDLDHKNKFSFYTKMPPKDFGTVITRPRKDSKIVLLFFGMISDYKRLDWLIKAVIDSKASNLKVIIAGMASDVNKRKYVQWIGENPIFDLHLEFVKNENIPKYFLTADFLVLPYESATQSGPSLIAVNYGIPIIASDVYAFKDLIIDGKTGFLFHKNSFESLVELICKVSKMSQEDILHMKKEQIKYKKEYMKENNIGKNFSYFIGHIMRNDIFKGRNYK